MAKVPAPRAEELPLVGPGGRIQAPPADTARIAPGFLDLHVHGRRGRDFLSGDPGELTALARDLVGLGITGWLATYAAAPEDTVWRALAALAQAYRDPLVRATCLGVHLEGPFLNPVKAGAQPKGALRSPDPDLLARLLDAAAFAPRRLVTLAPELPGAGDLLALIRQRGDMVNLGHSAASYEVAAQAIACYQAGATHLFNCMPPMHHRDPGLVAAALEASPRVELIADGAHVHPKVLALAIGVLGERAVVVSDGHPLADLAAGTYRHWDADYEIQAGQGAIGAAGTLGGSSATPLQMLRVLTGPVGLAKDRALALMTAQPARALGLAGARGGLETGKRADVLWGLDGARPEAVYLGGERVV